METFKMKVKGQEVEIALKNPSSVDVREADKIRAKAYNDALYKEKFPLASQAREEALKRGLWNDEKQAELIKLQNELTKNEKVLTKERNLKLGAPGDSGETMFNVAIKCQELRSRILDLRTTFANMEQNTVEGQAENERLNYILYATTVYKDNGGRFFESFEDFKNSTVLSDENAEKHAVATMAYLQYQTKLMGDYKKTLDDMPENKFLKRFKFIDEEGRFLKNGKFVNLAGEEVDKDGNPLGKVLKTEPPKPYIDENGNPIIDEEYKKELEEYQKSQSPTG